MEQIRRGNQWALESSHLGGKRVIIISPAEAMNESASNALLKTLEEPSDNCVFLLLAVNKNKLLPTIVSRCQKWQVSEPAAEETYHWLQSQRVKEINYTGIRLSKGAPLKAREFFEQGLYKKFTAMESSLLDFVRSGEADYSQVWATVKDEPIMALSWLSILLGDIQKVHFTMATKDYVKRASNWRPLFL